MKKVIHITVALLLVAGVAVAQQKPKTNEAARKDILQGNDYYRKSELGLASDYYKQALAKDPANAVAKYNLGNTLYQGKQFEAAAEAYGNTKGGSKAEQAKTLHNLGNAMMEQQQWQKAADAYKQSLKLNPNASDTRYNLAYAQEKLKKQQQDQQKKNDKNQDKKNQDKNKDQNKDKDKDKQDKKDQDKQKQDQNQKDNQDKKDQDKDKQDQRPQPQPSKMSQKQAEQLLNALNNEEKKVQDKMKKGQGAKVKMEKDW